MRFSTAGQRGIILYIALCVLAVLFIIVMSYQYLANADLRQARRIYSTRKAFYLARMGADQGVAYLKYMNRREEPGLSEADTFNRHLRRSHPHRGRPARIPAGKPGGAGDVQVHPVAGRRGPSAAAQQAGQ